MRPECSLQPGKEGTKLARAADFKKVVELVNPDKYYVVNY